MSDGGGVSSWNVAIFLIVALLIIDASFALYSNQANSMTKLNESIINGNMTLNTSSIIRSDEGAIQQIQDLKTDVPQGVPDWLNITIVVLNLLLILLAAVFIRGGW